MPSAPITIAHVDAESGFSGGEVQLFLLIEGLRRAGWRNVLIAPPGSAALAKAEQLGIEHRAVRMRNELDLGAVLALRGALARSGAALAHLHTGRATWLGGWAARWAGLPAITTRRMDRDVEPGLRTRLIYGRLVRRAVAISTGVAECLRRGGVPEHKIRTIWSSVDPATLAPQRAREELRAELGLERGTVAVLAAGALVRRKGYDVLLEALARSRRPRGSWRLLIAGDGEERTALAARVQALGLEGSVRFLGRREDMPDLLQACDVFAMPSRREGLGIAALEAMGAGLPVVASRVGGLAQVVLDTQTGLLVPAEDPDALAEALDRLIGHPALRRLFGDAGRARIEAGFRDTAMVAAYEDLYREVLAEARA